MFAGSSLHFRLLAAQNSPIRTGAESERTFAPAVDKDLADRREVFG
jgi:hypothetical protein